MAFSPSQFDNSEALRGIHQFKGDLLIIESGKDTVVPHETIQSYMDAAPDPAKVSHILIEGCTAFTEQIPGIKRWSMNEMC